MYLNMWTGILRNHVADPIAFWCGWFKTDLYLKLLQVTVYHLITGVIGNTFDEKRMIEVDEDVGFL